MTTPLHPRRPWTGSRVVLGVTGGIAAYKSIQLARDLTRLGAEVQVVLTRSAQKFVAPLTFEGVTGRPTLTDLFSAEGAALHIRLGREADVICVAPATADFLARAAQGRADDLLCTTLLATRAPVVLCPAMNDKMFSHRQVQANLEHVHTELGYSVEGPVAGALAVGEGEGPGRMIEPSQIVQAIGRALGRSPDFTGRRVLLTAGPTQEPIDPVRYVGNRSSGRMGYALAEAAWRRGAEVTLVSGPSSLDAPYGVSIVRVGTAVEMDRAVRDVIAKMDVSIFAAAVADFRPTDPKGSKVKRAASPEGLAVHLEENPDIAKGSRDVRKPGSIAVGFALETDDLIENARGKLERKGLDLVVANDATEDGAGFGTDTNVVTIVRPDGSTEPLPLQSKAEVAEEILDRVGALLADRSGG